MPSEAWLLIIGLLFLYFAFVSLVDQELIAALRETIAWRDRDLKWAREHAAREIAERDVRLRKLRERLRGLRQARRREKELKSHAE